MRGRGPFSNGEWIGGVVPLVGLEGVDNAVKLDMVGNQFFDNGDLIGIGGQGFDRHRIDAGSDGEAVGARSDHRDPGGFEESEETGIGENVPRKDNAGNPFGGVFFRALDGGVEDVFPVAGGNNEDTGPEEFLDATCGHVTDDELVDAADLLLRVAVKPVSVSGIDDLGEAGGLEGVILGHETEQGNPVAFQTLFDEGLDILKAIWHHLVNDCSDDLDPMLFEKGFVEGDFIDRSADAPAGDKDDLGTKKPGGLGVGKIEDGADAGMAGALNDDVILLVGGAVESAAKRVDKVGILCGGIIKIIAREGAVDGDRAHRLDGYSDVEDAIKEVGVLVDFMPEDLDKSLSDGLDIADVGGVGAKGRKEAEATGGLALVHAGGGNEDPLGRAVEGFRHEAGPVDTRLFRGFH